LNGALMAYRDYAATATLSGGNALPGYPLTSMQTRQLSKVYKTSSIGTFSFTADLGAVRDIRVVALLGTSRGPMNNNVDVVVEYSRNGSTWFTSTLMAGADAGVPSLASHLVVVPARPISDSTLPGGADVGVSARYVRISPTWAQTGLTRSIGRLWISDAIVIPSGVDGDWEQDFVDTGMLDFSDGQQAYEAPKNRVRVLRVNLSGLPADLAYGCADGASSAADAASIQGMQMEAGVTGSVLIVPRLDSPIWVRRLSIYGHIDANSRPAIRKQAGDNYSTQFTAIEER
jgi:hypothetical protein